MFILLPILASLVCIGIRVASNEGMILEKPREFIENNFSELIANPLISCIYCMASIWSIFTFTVLKLSLTLDINYIFLLVMIPATSAINRLVARVLAKHDIYV